MRVAFLLVCRVILAALALAGVTSHPALATTFTTTVPGTSIVIPTAYPQAGGVVIVLEGTNGNVYYQFSNPSTMFQGYQNNGAPAAWQGNPFQIAPTTTIQCGIQSCAQYFGGSIARMSVRFTAYDGDARAGEFDVNDLTLRINGFDVGSFTNVATQTTNTAGTTLIASATGFGNNTYDTGWYQTTNTALLSNVLINKTLTSSVFDRDPNDNYWDFRQGTNLSQTALEVVAPGVTLDKTANKTTFATVGEIIKYRFDLQNIGTVAINSLAVTDDKIPNASISCTPPGGTIAVGAFVQCNADYTVTQADIDAGKVTNIATSAGVPLFGSLGPLTDTVTVTGPAASPSFTFAKTVSPTTLGAVGSTLTYGFSFKNTGNVTLSNATVTDPALPGLSCSVQPIPPGQTASATCTNNTRTVTQAMIDAGSVSNTATGSLKTPSGTTLPGQSANAVSGGVTVTGGIALTKTSSPSPFGVVGSVVTYGFSIKNNTNVTVTGLTVSDPSLTTLSCTVPSAAPGATVAAACTGNTRTITQADIDAGQIVNNANASGSASGTTVSANASRTTPGPAKAPSLSIVKSSTTASFNAVNDPVDYAYVVKNTGNTTITTAITVADNKIVAPNTVNCPSLPSGGLAPGGTITCTAIYRAKQADIDAGGVTNSATAKSGATTSPADSITVPSVKEPAMTVAKSTDGAVVFDEGKTVNYKYVITNTGNTTLANPTVTDDRITTVNCPVGNIAPNATKTCTASYVITFADVDLGSVTNNAFAKSGTIQSPRDTVTIPTGATPAITLGKAASPTTFASVGETITYTFTVTNSGNATSTKPVTINDPKIGNFTCFTPTSGNTFAPTDIETCQRTYTITQADLDAGALTNTASASTLFGTSTTPTTTPSAEATITASAPTQVGALTVTKSVTPTTGAQVGDTLSYVLRAKNTGAVTLSNIVITDPKFPSLSCAIGKLAPNATSAATACLATYVVTQADIDAGSVTNTATASGTNPKGDPVSGTSPPANSTFTQTSSVDISKSVASNADNDGSSSISLGDVLTYRVTVTNSGTVSQTNVLVADARLAPPSKNCATLAPAAKCVLNGTYTVTQADVDAGKIDNQANVTTTLLPTAETVDLSTPVPRNPKIALEKTLGSVNRGPDNIINAGDTLTYTFKVKNTGNVSLSNVTVTDLVPAATVAGGPISLAPGESDTSTFTATYTLTQDDIDDGRVSNTAKTTATAPGGATVSDTSDDPSDPTGANDPTVVTLQQKSSLAIEKALTSSVPSPTVLNAVLTYTITATNDGSITQTAVVVSDPKLTPSSRTCATLLPGNTCILTGTYTVKQADVDAGRIANSASVTSTKLPTPETASLVTDVAQTTGLLIEKSTNTPPFDTVGDIITYKYKVTNTGTVTIKSLITVADDKITAPRDVNCPAPPAAGIPPNGFITCTATYEVTQSDLDAGSVQNTATAATAISAGQTVTSAPDSVILNAAQNPALSVSKSSPTASFDSVGDVLTYRYLVRNTGNVTLTSAITIADDKITAPNTVNCPALPSGGLKPTKTLTCTATYTVTQGDLDSNGVTNTASATSSATTSAPDSVTVKPVKKPALTVSKQTDGPVNFLNGQTVNYKYTVKNTGNVTLTAPTVTDNRIATVTCPAGDIAPNDQIVCTASYVLTVEDIDIGSVTNNATAKSGSTTSPPDSVTIPQGSDPALTLQKSASPTTFSELNETITYTFKVTNTGNVQFTRPVKINDPKIGNFTCLTPTSGNVFDVNETTTCTRTYKIKQADLDRGFLTNDASAETTYGASNLPVGSPSDSATIRATSTSQVPELSVTKTVSPATGAKLGDILTFNIAVKNTGKVTVSNITIDDPKLPAVSCTIATLAPGASSSASACTGTYTMTQADIDRGGFTNTATANGVAPDGGGVTGKDSVTANAATASPKLKIAKTSTATAFQAVGEPITYKFKVTNSGNVSISDISVTDPLIPAFDCTIAKLDPGESDDFTCEATYKVKQSDIDRGSLSNTATVTGKPARKGDPGDTNPKAEDTLEIAGPARAGGLTLVKSGAVISTNGNRLSVGDQIAYVFSLTNTGNVTLKDITIDDPKVQVSGGPIASLAPGKTDDTTLTATYKITQADIDRGTVSNSATATGTSPTGKVSDVSDSGAGDGNDPTLVNLKKLPSLAVKKVMKRNSDEDGSGAVSVNDTLNYVITATNTGNATLNNVKITDNRITPSTTTCITLAPDATCTLTGTYKVTESDVGSKEIVNTALVTSDEFKAGIAGLAATPVNSSVTRAQFSKTALKGNIRRGERVAYVIELNRVPLPRARVIDLMPPGFTYVAGSTRVNGVAATPSTDGRRLVFNNLVAPANKRIKIEFVLVASSAVSTGTNINVAQLVNPATGVVLGTARADVNVAPEHVFDCSDIIGKVFDDKNRNAYQDEGEPGLPGIRVATVKGLLVSTDKFGRFHVPCGEIPDEDIGSNFIMKLDTRTLPTGYRLTTENPRTIRVTRGKVSKLNFGATVGRVVKLDLNGKVFATGSTKLKPDYTLGFDKLIAVLDDDPSTLRIQYYVANEGEALAAQRVTAVTELIETLWARRSKRVRLPIETRLIAIEGAPSK